MRNTPLHRFALDGNRYVIDTETAFCFECDEVSWDVLEHYPHTPATRIVHLLKHKHPARELEEVIGELEWLRQTKAILPGRSMEEIKKQFEFETGCRELNIRLNAAGQAAEPWVRQAVALLLARSEKQPKLTLTVELAEPGGAVALAALLEEAAHLAKLAGKELEPRIRTHLGSRGADGAARLEVCIAANAPIAEALALLEKTDLTNPAKAAKLFDNPFFTAESCAILRVLDNNAPAGLLALEKAGFRHIRLDLETAFLQDPAASPEDILGTAEKIMANYAQQLQKGKVLRIEPLARMFWRIYNGTPQRRNDPAGTNALAIDTDATIYPSGAHRARKQHALGNLKAASLDHALLRRFEDLGATTTPACIQCWARNLCGGGTAAVNERLSGAWNTPHPPWCEAQRALIARSVANFNLLNQTGANFNRVYGELRPQKPKLGLFKMAWAATRMQVGLRGLEEGDAPRLKKWEDWSSAAYFTLHERSVLTTTVYDREMDALHPRGPGQEFLLTRKDGAPLGLLRVQPSPLPATVNAALFFADPADYQNEGIRKSVRFLLEEAAKSQAFAHILIQTGAAEKQLHAFLEALGFAHTGTLRRALYLHGTHHDVHCHHLRIQA